MDIHVLQKRPFYLSDGEQKWVSDTLAGMTEREKCGQLFNLLGNFYEEDHLHQIICELGVGGVLFRPAPKEEVARQFSDADRVSKIPLLKAANLEEGGAGVLSDGTFFGNALQVAATNDYDCTKSYAECCAKEGREAGVNWTFSPVVDIDMNYRNPITNVRTFGSDPAKVSAHAKVFVETIQKYGVAASCKHFPGDGVDFRDQHNHPTYNTLSADEWFSTYGRIYQEMINADLLSVMVGHIVQPNVIREINPNGELLPGSQSKEMMTGVLRERFGFNGVIITDATLMGGYTMPMKRAEAIPASVMAGADMLCFSTDIYEDVGYLMDALGDGRLTKERLDDAVLRILAMKAVLNRSYPIPELDCSAQAAICADKAITLVKDTQALIPVKKERYPNVKLVTLCDDNAYDGSVTEIAAKLLEEKGFHVEKFDPRTATLNGPAKLPENRLTLILCNCPTESFKTASRIFWSGGLSFELPRFVNEEPVAFISFANPYHLQDVPCIRTFINAYGVSRATITAAISKLLGESEFTGTSPVDPFCGLPEVKEW